MPRLLFHSDIPLINQLINDSPVKDLISSEPLNVTDVQNTIYYISDDGMDLVAFDKVDRRVHHGHNIMTNKLKTALVNARAFIDLHFSLFPDLEIIVGLTPWNLKPTRIFNKMLGFKLVGGEYNASDILCYRYELRRSEWLLQSK